MIKKTIITFLLPFTVISQEVNITKLSKNINTSNAEMNFIQINDSTAYYTSVMQSNDILESCIYQTNLKSGRWSKKKYSIYNSDLYSTANICFLDDLYVFFTMHYSNLSESKPVYIKDGNSDTIYSIFDENLSQFIYTQPFIFSDTNQKVLYFVSNKAGGYGGLDIWLLIIDNKGNFGSPINAGNRINSSSDEITPFYNINDGMLYFSSNKTGGKGGFDIYRSEGSLNLWKQPHNVSVFNTNKDEMYLNFYNKNTGYFASNRDIDQLNFDDACCNDIFSFTYKKPTIDSIAVFSKCNSYLPLDLYFHNDEPNPGSMKTSSNKTYKQSYVSYFKLKELYEKKNPNVNYFFNNVLQTNFNTLNIVLDLLLFDLQNGNRVEIKVKGYSSPLYTSTYNINLSKRRISSLINYLSQYKKGVLKQYILSRDLIITEIPFGESNSSSKVSDDKNDLNQSIYSIEAMLERKIEIIEILLND